MRLDINGLALKNLSKRYEIKMAGSVNKVILIGNLGRDPEIRTTNNGTELATLNIATTDTWKDKTTGERKEKTEWHRVVVFNEGLVKVIKSYLKKGSKIYVEGALQTREWQDDSAQKRYTTEIVLQGYGSTLHMLDKRNDNNYDSSSINHSHNNTSQNVKNDISFDDSDLDDKIPF